MSREQIVKDTAYAIWEAEGKPDGRAEEHWRQAEARVAASLTDGTVKVAAGIAKAPAKGKALGVSKDPAAKPPAKAAATKAAATSKTPIKKAAGTIKATKTKA